MHWYVMVLKKYAVFSGRARRKEYWMFVLFNFLIAVALSLVEGILAIAPERDESVLATIYQLAILIPAIAVGVRRMHDTDHSGWWLLLPIVNLVFAVREGQNGENRFGPDPKATPAAQFMAASAPGAAAVPGQVRTQGVGQTPNTFCIRCGTQFPEIAAYCPNCGAPRTA